MKITKEQFQEYEYVRSSGVTNMFAISVVADLSGLTKEEIQYIMKNYDALNKQYPGVRE